jgi:hypothetical protein
VSSSWARQHQTWAHLKRAGRGQHRPSSIHPPLQVTCASFLRQVHRRMHHLQTRSVATTAQHLTDAHHSDRLPQAAVARPSGGGGVGGHVAGCDRQTVVHDFDFYFLKPPEGVVPNVNQISKSVWSYSRIHHAHGRVRTHVHLHMYMCMYSTQLHLKSYSRVEEWSNGVVEAYCSRKTRLTR